MKPETYVHVFLVICFLVEGLLCPQGHIILKYVSRILNGIFITSILNFRDGNIMLNGALMTILLNGILNVKIQDMWSGPYTFKEWLILGQNLGTASYHSYTYQVSLNKYQKSCRLSALTSSSCPRHSPSRCGCPALESRSRESVRSRCRILYSRTRETLSAYCTPAAAFSRSNPKFYGNEGRSWKFWYSNIQAFWKAFLRTARLFLQKCSCSLAPSIWRLWNGWCISCTSLLGKLLGVSGRNLREANQWLCPLTDIRCCLEYGNRHTLETGCKTYRNIASPFVSWKTSKMFQSLVPVGCRISNIFPVPVCKIQIRVAVFLRLWVFRITPQLWSGTVCMYEMMGDCMSWTGSADTVRTAPQTCRLWCHSFVPGILPCRSASFSKDRAIRKSCTSSYKPWPHLAYLYLTDT